MTEWNWWQFTGEFQAGTVQPVRGEGKSNESDPPTNRRQLVDGLADMPIRHLLIVISLATVSVSVAFGNASWIMAIHASGRPQVNTAQYPMYGFLRAPQTFGEQEVRGHFAVDFLQVYLGARRFFEKGTIYERQHDFFGRLPTYPPLTHFLYAPLASRYPPAVATQVHLWLQVTLLCVSTAIVLGGRRWRQAIASWTIMLCFLFASPVGLAWAERGQFDIYSAVACLFGLSAVLQQKYAHFLLCGVFAALKWSVLPFLFVLFGLHVFVGRGEERMRWMQAGSVAVVVAASLVVFPKSAIAYLHALRVLELAENPVGISLGQVFPAWLYKTFPFALLGLGVPFLRWTRSRCGTPYFEVARMAALVAVCILLTMYGTNCFEYRALVQLGLLPAFLVWLDDSRQDGWPGMARVWRNIVVLVFPLALALTLRLFFRDLLFMKWDRIVLLFLALSMTYFGLAVSAPVVVKLAERERR
jgi:hypothetical protein